LQTTIIKILRKELTDNERKFLISLKEGEPDYTLMPFDNLQKLPALQWKLINIHNMPPKKHRIMLEKLKKVLE